MPLDPIEEIRAIRAEIMREYDYDMDKYGDAIEAAQSTSGRTYVQPPRRRIKKAVATKPDVSPREKKRPA